MIYNSCVNQGKRYTFCRKTQEISGKMKLEICREPVVADRQNIHFSLVPL